MEKEHNCARFQCAECHKSSTPLHVLPPDLNRYIYHYIEEPITCEVQKSIGECEEVYLEYIVRKGSKVKLSHRFCADYLHIRNIMSKEIEAFTESFIKRFVNPQEERGTVEIIYDPPTEGFHYTLIHVKRDLEKITFSAGMFADHYSSSHDNLEITFDYKKYFPAFCWMLQDIWARRK